jgi:GTP-binding protein HflX
VENILDEIGAGGRPRYLVLNKCDKLGPGDEVYISDRAKHTYGKVMRVSAITGDGLDALAEQIQRFFTGSSKRFELLVPYSDGASMAELRRSSVIESEEYLEQGIKVTGSMPSERLVEFASFGERGRGESILWTTKVSVS